MVRDFPRATANFFLDGVLPILFVFRLNMDFRRKVHISIMLGLGTMYVVLFIPTSSFGLERARQKANGP